MAHSHPFSSLPYEIVSQICQHPHLDKDDRAALRLTCKSFGIHDAATVSIGKYFEDTKVLFTKHSFETLVKICKHPVFSRCIKSVKLSSIRCNNDERLQTTTNLLQMEASRSDQPVGVDSRLQALDNISARIHSYSVRNRCESDRFRSSKPVELLTIALKCLSQSGNRIALGIAVDETNGLGCGRVLRAKNIFSSLWYNAIYSTLEILATAISDSSYPFGKLIIDARAMDIFDFSLPRRRTVEPAALKMFTHVKALDLQAFCFCQWNSDHNLASLVAEVFSKPTQIKVLRVLGADTSDWKWSTHNPSSLRCISSVSSLFLESLSLTRIEITASVLRSLLVRVQQTLRYLNIDKCLTRNDTLLPVIVFIKDHLGELDELHITDISVMSKLEDIFALYDDDHWGPKDKYESELLACINAYGQRNIQSSLAGVLLGYKSRPVTTPSS
ncbi:hypothetical protein KCU81_g8131, partial [Aureobasidium melanogenum]|uniref:F-box domain-containing protein n=1 Tax=Aureobasidium melanogenum (strain CBS 110374) TaxID=1043003 RepID=A0A074VKD0_AURM1